MGNQYWLLLGLGVLYTLYKEEVCLYKEEVCSDGLCSLGADLGKRAE